MKSNIDKMLKHAEYIVWLSEVDTGMVDHQDAFTLIEQAWYAVSFVHPPTSPRWDILYRTLSQSQTLFDMYTEWKRSHNHEQAGA